MRGRRIATTLGVLLGIGGCALQDQDVETCPPEMEEQVLCLERLGDRLHHFHEGLLHKQAWACFTIATDLGVAVDLPNLSEASAEQAEELCQAAGDAISAAIEDSGSCSFALGSIDCHVDPPSLDGCSTPSTTALCEAACTTELFASLDCSPPSITVDCASPELEATLRANLPKLYLVVELHQIHLDATGPVGDTVVQFYGWYQTETSCYEQYDDRVSRAMQEALSWLDVGTDVLRSTTTVLGIAAPR